MAGPGPECKIISCSVRRVPSAHAVLAAPGVGRRCRGRILTVSSATDWSCNSNFFGISQTPRYFRPIPCEWVARVRKHMTFPRNLDNIFRSTNLRSAYWRHTASLFAHKLNRVLVLVVELVEQRAATEFTLHFAAHVSSFCLPLCLGTGIDRLSEVPIYSVTSRMHMGCNVMDAMAFSAFCLCGARCNFLKAFCPQNVNGVTFCRWRPRNSFFFFSRTMEI